MSETTPSIQSRVEAVLTTVLAPSKAITIDSTLEELGADEFDLVDIDFALEDVFDLDEIPDETAAKWKTVKDIVDYITTKLA